MERYLAGNDIHSAFLLRLVVFKNAAIPLAALCGALTFYLLTSHVERTQSHAN
ncbi:hypothetical protein ALT785_580123 [Alteromonas infernus]